jgi:hypothetical protein
LHQDVVVAQLVYLVEDDEHDVVQPVENPPEPLVVRRRGQPLVRNPNVGHLGTVHALGDGLDGLRLGRVLRAVDVGEGGRHRLLAGGVDQSL